MGYQTIPTLGEKFRNGLILHIKRAALQLYLFGRRVGGPAFGAALSAAYFAGFQVAVLMVSWDCL